MNNSKKKEGNCKFILCILSVVVFLFLISLVASMEGSYSISSGNLTKSYYAPNEDIKGEINLTLVDSPTDLSFTDNFGNQISLIDLIRADSGLTEGSSYSCNVKGCGSMFEAFNSEESKSFYLNSGEEKVIGIKFVGDLLDIKNVSFDISSNAEESCFNQLEIDLLNDGNFEKGNKNSGSSFCSFMNGCFNSSLSNEDYVLDKNGYYCQNMTLPEAPGYKLGTSIKEVDSGDMKLFMELRDSSGNSIEGTSCELSKSTLSEEYSEISCQIDYYNKEQKNHYVCVYANDGEGNYEIEGLSKNSETKCGYNDVRGSSGNSVGSYNIFSESKIFGNFEELHISNALPNENSVSSKFQEYINKKYNGCSSGCVVPISFVSSKNQDIEISNLSIQSDYSAGSVKENEFSYVREIPSRINLDSKELSLDKGNFSVPSAFGDYFFELSLDENVVFEENITVESVPVINYLTPTITYANYPNEFEVNITLTNSSLRSVKWNFGNAVKESSSRKITHTYNSSGAYPLEIVVSDNKGRASKKTFNIIVGNPKNVSGRVLNEKIETLSNFTNTFSEVGSYKSLKIKSLVNFDSLESELEEIQKDYSSSMNEEEYKEVLGKLLNLSIPKSLKKTSEADSISFYPDTQIINTEIVSEVFGKEISNSEIYKNSIAAWNLENLNSSISYEEYSILYDDSKEDVHLVSFFTLDFHEGYSGNSLVYLFIKKLSGLDYSKNYLTTSVSGYDYLVIDDLSEYNNKIIFSFTESLLLDALPVFASPELSQLNIQEDVNSEPASEGAGFWTWFLVFLLFVLIGLVFYTILQEWYKFHYEKYLFKDRTKLFNIINYIVLSKKKKLKDSQIYSQLKKAGWSGEQVSYAMKKFYGKRTGMFEIIPVEKLRKYLREKKDKKSSRNNKKPFFGKNLGNKRFSNNK